MRSTSRLSSPCPAIGGPPSARRARRPPQVDGLAGPARERQRYLGPRARGLVRGEDRLQHRAAVLAGHLRLAIVEDAVHEVRHLAVEAVVPGLLVDREAPA